MHFKTERKVTARRFTIALAFGALFGLPAIAQSSLAATKSESPPPAAAPTRVAAPSPAPAARGDRMAGLATTYSNRFDGRKTASGQVFDQNALTGAHRTLPFGTKVKVTNTRNDRSVVVRINDRGPTQPGRVIDLSRAAAAKLSMLRAGRVPVKLELIAAAPAEKARK